jgi:hypothetical protein
MEEMDMSFEIAISFVKRGSPFHYKRAVILRGPSLAEDLGISAVIALVNSHCGLHIKYVWTKLHADGNFVEFCERSIPFNVSYNGLSGEKVKFAFWVSLKELDNRVASSLSVLGTTKLKPSVVKRCV